MTDQTDDRRAEPPLEPWALELEERGADPEVRHELSRVVALLRDLPEPEVPTNLAARILERVAEERARPRRLRAILDRAPAFSPRIGLALAAGIAGVLVVTAAPGPLSVSIDFGAPGAPTVQAANPAPVVIVRDATQPARQPTALPRRSTATVVPQFVSAYTPSAAPRPRAHERTSVHSAFDDQLDRQLNQLMLDPNAFARRLERMSQPESFIARLAERAARRGDAPEIALSVRRSQHPLARRIVHHMLRATLVTQAQR